jgi:hypothetical protein
MKSGASVLYEKLPEKCEFHENRHSDERCFAGGRKWISARNFHIRGLWV